MILNKSIINNEKIVFQCKNNKTTKKFLLFLHEQECVWYDGDSLLKGINRLNFGNVCFRIIYEDKLKLLFDSTNYYKQRGYKIVDFGIQRVKHLAVQHLNEMIRC